MEWVQFFSQNSWAYLLCVSLFSLLIGSFLNVVIHRVPIMMKREWREECLEFLEMTAEEKSETFNLFAPRSRCPSCENQITAWQNIPIISYLFLKGRCANCQKAISLRYPMVEFITALASIMVALHFGVSLPALFALLLTWALIAITLIDYDEKFIPDTITLPMLWLGLLINMHAVFVPLEQAIYGAVFGYLSLWSFAKLFYLVTGKEGMGHGDFKLFALFGAWMGVSVLPFIILASSIVGAIVGIIMIIFQSADRHTTIPFGPYLATAGWIALLFGDSIIRWYLNLSGLTPIS